MQEYVEERTIAISVKAAKLSGKVLAAEQSIPGRPATWQESLRLMGAGWGSIFIVILVIMLCVYLLNRIFRSKDPK